jgi:hypothetical protein
MSSPDFLLPDDTLLDTTGLAGDLPPRVFPPLDSVSFDPTAYIALPAIGATTAVLTLVVDDGYLGVLRVMGNVFVGVGWTEGSGALVWQILDNAGVIRNYDNIVSSLGSVDNPRPLGGGAGILVQEGHTVVLQVKNVSLNVGGAQVGARLGGWLFPKSYLAAAAPY